MKHPFRSAIASQFETYVLSRKAACRWCKVYDDNLHFSIIIAQSITLVKLPLRRYA